MKIFNVKVKNVRSYKDLDIELSPYLNVINGDSDSGKSGLVKALLFAIRNHCPKRTIRNNSDGESSVSISDNVTEVIRIKDKGVNGYSIIAKGLDPKNYNAISTDIPLEVSKVLNLSDTNIQQQKETYFLVDKTDGVISKKLNEVSGLSEIDTSLKLITTEINSIASDIREANNRIAEDKEKIEDTKWSILANTELSIIEKLEIEIDELEKVLNDIGLLVNSYKEIKSQLNNLLPTSIIEDYYAVNKLKNEVDSIQINAEKVQIIIQRYKETKRLYADCEIIDLSVVDKIIEDITVLDKDIRELSSYFSTYNNTKKLLSVVEQNLIETTKLIGEVKTCPLCRQQLVTK